MAASTNTAILLPSKALPHASPPATWRGADPIWASSNTARIMDLRTLETVYVPTVVYEAPPPSNEVAGDYETRFVHDLDIDFAGGRTSGYVVPLNSRVVIKGYTFSNISASSVTVSLWFGGFKFLNAVAIPANTSLSEEVWEVLYPADLIEYQASAAGVQLNVSGIEAVRG